MFVIEGRIPKLLGNAQWLKITLDLTLSRNYEGVTRLINPQQHPTASVAASPPRGEHEEATEGHQLSSTATTSFHATEGNGHRVSLLAKLLHFGGGKRRVNTVYGKGKKKTPTEFVFISKT